MNGILFPMVKKADSIMVQVCRKPAKNAANILKMGSQVAVNGPN